MNEQIPDFDRIDAAAAQIGAINNVVPIVAQEEQAKDGEISSAELLQPLLTIGFSLLAPNWQIQQEEIEQLSEAYGALVDKYFPDTGLDRFGPEISAVMVTAMIVMPRAKIPRIKKKPIEKPEKGKEVKMESQKNAS